MTITAGTLLPRSGTRPPDGIRHENLSDEALSILRRTIRYPDLTLSGMASNRSCEPAIGDIKQTAATMCRQAGLIGPPPSEVLQHGTIFTLNTSKSSP